MMEILDGLNSRIRRMPGRVILAGDAGDEFALPWQIRCEVAPRVDDPEKVEWRAYLTPGFVNGRDVTIRSLRASAQNGSPTLQDVPLTDEEPPYLVLSWRNPIRSVAASSSGDQITLAPGEGYPPYFASVGVKPAEQRRTADQTEDAIPEQDPTRTRELRACDIVLVTPRLATRSDITVQDPFSTSTVATVSTVFVNDHVRAAPSPHRLIAEPKWNPPKEPNLLERMLGTAAEPQTDEIKIGTVWMVSPPDADPDSEPDASWTPYPQHFVFWNLMHATRNQVPDAPQPPVTVRTGLPWADFLGSILLTPINDAFSQIQALLSSADYKGEYWTV